MPPIVCDITVLGGHVAAASDVQGDSRGVWKFELGGKEMKYRTVGPFLAS